MTNEQTPTAEEVVALAINAEFLHDKAQAIVEARAQLSELIRERGTLIGQLKKIGSVQIWDQTGQRHLLQGSTGDIPEIEATIERLEREWQTYPDLLGIAERRKNG